MTLTIITADQRIADHTVKGQVWGPAGVGKTTLLKTLDNPSTLCLSAENGMLSVQREDQFGPAFTGDSIEPSNWLEVDAITDGFCGVPNAPFASASQRAPALQKYKTVFIDSTSIVSKWCFEWCQTQPEAFSDKKTKPDGSPMPDTRGAYGLLARVMTKWAWRWKNAPGINVWLVGGLERKEVNGIVQPVPLLAGAKLVQELPFIMDYVLVMERFQASDKQTYTGLFTDPTGEYRNVPVKVRGGGFDPIERPHLGQFMAKALGRPAVIAPPPSVAA